MSTAKAPAKKNVKANKKANPKKTKRQPIIETSGSKKSYTFRFDEGEVDKWKLATTKENRKSLTNFVENACKLRSEKILSA